MHRWFSSILPLTQPTPTPPPSHGDHSDLTHCPLYGEIIRAEAELTALDEDIAAEQNVPAATLSGVEPEQTHPPVPEVAEDLGLTLSSPISLGRVLDAGTGPHSASFLHSLWSRQMVQIGVTLYPVAVSSVVGVTGTRWMEAETLAAGKKKGGVSSGIPVVRGDWADPTSLRLIEPADTVIADYLLGALDGVSPFFQAGLFPALRRVTRRRLHVIGLQPVHLTKARDSRARLIQRLYDTRDACILLGGKRPYREIPETRAVQLLGDAGFAVRRVRRIPSAYGHSYLIRQVKVGRDFLSDCPSEAARAGLGETLDELEVQIRAERWDGFTFGFDYVIAADPIPGWKGSGEEGEKVEEEGEEKEEGDVEEK